MDGYQGRAGWTEDKSTKGGRDRGRELKKEEWREE